MASDTEFTTLNLTTREITRKVYSGTVDEQYAAYRADHDLGATKLCGTRTLAPAVPLVVFGG